MRPLSTNIANEYSKYGVSKSDKYRIFEAEFEIKMVKYREELEEIRASFDPEKHCIGLEFKFYFPCETKSGRLHKRAGDLTNGLKSLEDALFNLLEIDDAFVTDLRAYKMNAKKPMIVIDFWIKEYVSI
jgi:Holliday junction resolvase RusA-like endonuclease